MNNRRYDATVEGNMHIDIRSINGHYVRKTIRTDAPQSIVMLVVFGIRGESLTLRWLAFEVEFKSFKVWTISI